MCWIEGHSNLNKLIMLFLGWLQNENLRYIYRKYFLFEAFRAQLVLKIPKIGNKAPKK
jgi:hypothetical protein